MTLLSSFKEMEKISLFVKFMWMILSLVQLTINFKKGLVG
jgi:hypothetical protein